MSTLIGGVQSVPSLRWTCILASSFKRTPITFLPSMLLRNIHRTRHFQRLKYNPIEPHRHFTSSLRRVDQQSRPGVTTNHKASPAPKSSTNGSQLPVLPLVAIFCIGSLSFYWLTKTRQGQGQSHFRQPPKAPSKEQRSPRKLNEQ